MPTIANFPEDLLEEHKNWHHAHHVDDPSQLRPGYGSQFLQFHRGFIRRALDWYGRQSYDSSLVAPWQRVPEEIRQAPCYDRSAEARILMQPQTFRTADELGLFIEGSGLHGCIHETAAAVFNEPDLNDFDVAPRNTVFYNIHGMIDGWYRNWEAAGRVNQGMLEWGGRFAAGAGERGDSAETEEMLRYVPESGRWWLGGVPEGNSARGKFLPLNWRLVGENGVLGAKPDARFLRVWDTDGDGRSEVLYYSLPDGKWWEGKLSSGKLNWQEIKRSLA
ncbi:hypothetical protein OMP38_19185 [Cohnella ginsengisoli]|uniref:Uncharacterized protein n=1 Tax=Cohnella ginsengisoli TaxID=425004 RepID=A0A9X4KIM1_9BACL|nr:hypothetical protein [Cohnella ginsengisoli]MDG0792758.1 hypothetical protein [Cohnella ginsengisoli]